MVAGAKARRRRGADQDDVGGLFSFDEDGGGGDAGDASSSSKNAKKRLAKVHMAEAERLERLSAKELQKEDLDEELAHLVALAKKLPRRNQGKQRLLKDIAKRLRQSKD